MAKDVDYSSLLNTLHMRLMHPSIVTSCLEWNEIRSGDELRCTVNNRKKLFPASGYIYPVRCFGTWNSWNSDLGSSKIEVSLERSHFQM